MEKGAHVNRKLATRVGLYGAGLLLCAACNPDIGGFYLHEAVTEDVALDIRSTATSAWGRLVFFPPGDPLPAKTYDFGPTNRTAPLEFTTPVTNVADSGDVGTLSLTFSGPDSASIDLAEGEVVLADGTHPLTMPETDPLDYDHYKCPDGHGHCRAVAAPATCTFEPLPGFRTYHVTAVIPFKSAEGASVFAGNQPAIGDISTEGSGLCTGSPPIPGTSIACGDVLLTISLEGDTAGTLTFDLDHFSYYANSTDALFAFDDQSSCPLPPA